MPRNLDSSLATALSNNLIQPVVLAALTFASGVIYVWSGVGNFVYNGNTYLGVGTLGKISAISEGSEVKADGMEITLSGIGLSPIIANGNAPEGFTPPVTVPSGTYVAFARAGNVAPVSYGSNCSVEATTERGAIFMADSALGQPVGGTIIWSDFQLPTLPDDAVITALYPVGYVYTLSPFGETILNGLNLPGGTSAPYALALTSGSEGTDPAVLGTYQIGLSLGDSLSGDHPEQTFGMEYVGFAVYYTSASDAQSMVNEAMSDFQSGAPAQIWFGLMNNGALIGSPYLIFSGQMDQPIIDMSTQTASITISLENRLSNLLRPTARRYTAADQHLQYPDDIGFNWQEVLNDLSLRWGS